MVKDEKEDDVAGRKLRRSGMKLFLYVRKVWLAITIRENIKVGQTKGSVKLNKQMNVFSSNEPPELLMF